MKLTLLVVVLLIAAAATVLPQTEAAAYVVGDTTGWTTPSGNATFSTSWAAKHNFSVGDILAFNFTTGVHDLATVSQVAFDACNTSSNITLTKTGPANFTLNSTGSYYFICTFPQHCSRGQKLAINVTNANSSGTSPPPPAGVILASPPPPSGSSASSLAATFSLILITISSTIFYRF
ncbi:umecyanin-like [Corylus avellana]|uniref:umecyanin-like n=1 Tax=Corylus avellana TaxID=13451 RepID=UPI001E202C0F|nr:umecyanin-like [Corylus avellana]